MRRGCALRIARTCNTSDLFYSCDFCIRQTYGEGACSLATQALSPSSFYLLGRSSLNNPRADQVTFLLGHLGDVAQWHDLAGDRLSLDAGSVLADLFWRIEHHAGRCGTEQRAGGFGRVTDRATFLNHAVNLVERRALIRGLGRCSGRRIRFRRFRFGTTAQGGFRQRLVLDGPRCLGHFRCAGHRRRAGHVGQANHADRRNGQGPGEFVAVVTGVEVVTHQHRQHRDPGQDQPVVLAAVRAREVVADHDEQHRQGEVVVVPRTQQTFGRQRRIGRAVFGDRRHQCALGWHDDAEHVANHDGADDRADVQVRATTAEHFAEAVGGADDQHEQDCA
ncbi:hypothetical protein EMIT0180MI3_360047 [Priestia megaterium]